MKKLSLIVLLWYVLWLELAIVLSVYDNYIHSKILLQGYVKSINTPYYGERTKDVLQEFNSKGNNKIVATRPKHFNRPITIKEKEDLNTAINDILKTNTLGTARVTGASCEIILKKGMPHDKFRRVLIHEYLHCMGYEHVDKEADLMAPQYSPKISEENINWYAKDLESKM